MIPALRLGYFRGMKSLVATLFPYRSPDAREADLMRLTEAAGGELVELGKSVEERPIWAARIPSSGSGEEKPKVLLSGNIHGVEFIATHLVLAFLQALAEKKAPMVGLMDRAEIWLIPSINPDAYARTWEVGGRGSLAELRKNANGVDLNRNFPLPQKRRAFFAPGAGSSNPSAATYHGKSPMSEPETQALCALFERTPFHASANLHSFMGTLITPRVPRKIPYRAYSKLCRAFGDAQKSHRYRRLASRHVDAFTGEQEDHQHHVHDTWATCVEIFPVRRSLMQHLRAPNLFWRFNPREPDWWALNDLPGLTAYFDAALSMPPPSQVDALKAHLGR
jgi:hypothetical protein